MIELKILLFCQVRKLVPVVVVVGGRVVFYGYKDQPRADQSNVLVTKISAQ